MIFRLIKSVGVIALFCIVSAFAAEQTNVKPAELATAADEKIQTMQKVLTQLSNDLASAKKGEDIRKINCILRKKNLVEGLVKASEKARYSLKDAVANQDQSASSSYAKKISTYEESVGDVGKSASECSANEGQSQEEGVAVSYIHPEASEYVSEREDPWDPEGVLKGGEGYPVVPPTSPFR